MLTSISAKLKFRVLSIALPAWAALAICPLPGQTLTGPAKDVPYVPTMTFDITSVRENKTVDPNEGFTMSGQFVPHTTTLRLRNWDIENLIGLAYGVDRYQLERAPKWPFATVFMVEAKGDSTSDAKLAALSEMQQGAEQQHMLRTLLEDRFKLKTHWETKDGDVYNLVVMKGGPKLSSEGSIPPSAEDAKLYGDRPIPPLRQVNDGQGYDFIAYRCSMAQLTAILTSQFGRPVIDKTGLTAKYDFVLKYKGRWDKDREPDDPDPTPPMDRALQDDLGLKTVQARGPTKVLVIDHVEKPSEN
jgi:uncharacterized protein (TIGR03435 family)